MYITCLALNTSGCSDGEVRLIGGRSEFEGTVEICLSNAWGSVCDNYWGYEDAEVVCRQLGFAFIGKESSGYCHWLFC